MFSTFVLLCYFSACLLYDLRSGKAPGAKCDMVKPYNVRKPVG